MRDSLSGPNRGPFRVKTGEAQPEQMSSASPRACDDHPLTTHHSRIEASGLQPAGASSLAY
jgi:hypothetical protein